MMSRSGIERSLNLQTALHALPLYGWGWLSIVCGVVMVDRAVALLPQAWLLPLIVTAGLIFSLYYRYRGLPHRPLYTWIGLTVIAVLGYIYFFDRDLIPLNRLLWDGSGDLEARIYLILSYLYIGAVPIRSFMTLRDQDVMFLLMPTLSIEALLTATDPSPFNLSMIAVSSFGLVAVMRTLAVQDIRRLGELHRRSGQAVPRRVEPRLLLSLLLAALLTLLTALNLWHSQRAFERLFNRISWRVIESYLPQIQARGRHSWASRPFRIGPVPGSDEGAIVALADIDIPLYWRETAYDLYTGDGWQASVREADYISAGNKMDLKPEQPPRGRKLGAGVEIRQFVSPYILAPYRITSLETDAVVSYSPEYGSVAFQFPPGRPISYSLVSVVPDDQPERHGTPEGVDAEEVRKEYTALPALSPRVTALAHRITAGAEGRLQKARAIQKHLLGSYDYSLDVGEPRGEAVEYFLFKSRRGHCQYFATAMVVLARLNGIPARFATGYLPEEVDDRGRSVMRLRNAHAWAELYIPGSGWVIFEATPGRSAPTPSAVASISRRLRWLLQNESFRFAAAAIIGALVLMVLANRLLAFVRNRLFLRRRRREAMEEFEEAEGTAGERIIAVYRTALRYLGETGHGRRDWETPDEYLLRLSVVNVGGSPLAELTDIYQKTVYASREQGLDAAARAALLLQELVLPPHAGAGRKTT